MRGSGVIPVCNNGLAGGGATYTDATCDPNHADDKNVGGDPTPGAGGSAVVGYLALDPTARYVTGGRGVRTTVGRNSWLTPGFSVLNVSLAKNTYFAEGKYLQVRADVFNILNHPSFALSNGNVFSVAGVTTATTTQGYVLPTDANFLRPDQFFSGGIRSMTLVLRLVF
jgi:hypothetical protein